MKKTVLSKITGDEFGKEFETRNHLLTNRNIAGTEIIHMFRACSEDILKDVGVYDNQDRLDPMYVADGMVSFIGYDETHHEYPWSLEFTPEGFLRILRSISTQGLLNPERTRSNA